MAKLSMKFFKEDYVFQVRGHEAKFQSTTEYQYSFEMIEDLETLKPEDEIRRKKAQS